MTENTSAKDETLAKLATKDKQPSDSPKGGNITANVNEAATGLVRSSLKDGVEVGRKANDAFALGFTKTRQAGTEQMLQSVSKATDATAAAISAVDLSALEDELGDINPFSGGPLSLLG